MVKIFGFMVLCVNLYAQSVAVTPEQQKSLGIQTQKVGRVGSIVFAPYNGKVVLDNKNIISIGSNVESIVKKIYVSNFEKVKKGQKLLTLKSNALLNLQREYIESILEKTNVYENYQRDLKLESEGIISKKRLLESEKINSSASLRVKLNANQLLTNGFTKEMLEKVEKTSLPILEQDILSPQDGVVYKIDVNVGEYIDAQHTMVGIYANGKRYIEISVPVKIVNELSIGDRCSFGRYEAKIIAIGQVVNTSSQSVQIRAQILNPKNIMINRVYGVKIHKKTEDTLKVKKSALVFRNNRAYLFKKIENGFEAIEANIVSESGYSYFVKAKLSENDFIAINATAALLSSMENGNE